MQGECTDLLMIKTAGGDRGYLGSLGSLEDQTPSWCAVTFPLSAVKRVPWTEGTVESVALGDLRKLGPHLSCLMYPLQPHC